ncbi:MAG: tetratricopeptide repeat protein [Terriglobales bacterium]
MPSEPNLENLSPNLRPFDFPATSQLDYPRVANAQERRVPSAVIARMMAIALVQHRAGRFSQAEQIYRQILAVDCNHADSLHLLGMIAFQAGNPTAAVRMIRQAIAINKTQAAYHSNLGTVLQSQGRLDEAATCYERALALQPDSPEIHTNLGNIFHAQDKVDEAIASHQRALALKPDLPEAHYNLGLAQLLKGDFTSGWPHLEWRWRTKDHDTQMRAYPQPLWTGEKLGSGRVLIWGEQGVGDEIMFAGLIPDVIRTGTRCLLDCDPRLQLLFARSFPDVEVVSSNNSGNDSEHPPERDFAAHLPSGSLRGMFRASNAAFAATASPYLTADADKRERFRARYDDGRRLVGLAWYTRNQKTGRDRSIDLSLLAPLFEHADIQWVNLQYGDHDTLQEQATAAGAPILIDRSVDQLADIDIFAAQIAALDLVITIDNSTAHLAGALGVPVWVLLPFARDWRWLQLREDSPWYPTMRLFRQSQRGDWQSVVQEAQSALSAFIDSDTRNPCPLGNKPCLAAYADSR